MIIVRVNGACLQGLTTLNSRYILHFEDCAWKLHLTKNGLNLTVVDKAKDEHKDPLCSCCLLRQAERVPAARTYHFNLAGMVNGFNFAGIVEHKELTVVDARIIRPFPVKKRKPPVMMCYTKPRQPTLAETTPIGITLEENMVVGHDEYVVKDISYSFKDTPIVAIRSDKLVARLETTHLEVGNWKVEHHLPKRAFSFRIFLQWCDDKHLLVMYHTRAYKGAYARVWRVDQDAKALSKVCQQKLPVGGVIALGMGEGDPGQPLNIRAFRTRKSQSIFTVKFIRSSSCMQAHRAHVK